MSAQENNNTDGDSVNAFTTPYDDLELAEELLEELNDIRNRLPKLETRSESEAYNGLGKAILNGQRHVEFLMKSFDGSSKSTSRTEKKKNDNSKFYK